MIYVLGGGVGTLYACIGVTYPSGSTCTCTNGTKTLTAKGTSGTAIFNVPSTGTWTVTATNGDKTASKSVSVTAEGQTESVTLAYEYVLYEAGAKYVTFEEKSGRVTYANVTWGKEAATIQVVADSSGYLLNVCINTSEIDLSNYSHLKCTLSSLTIQSSSSSYHYALLGVSSSTEPNLGDNLIASTKLTSANTSSKEQTVDVDISSVSSGTVQFGVSGGQGYLTQAVMTKLWLE